MSELPVSSFVVATGLALIAHLALDWGITIGVYGTVEVSRVQSCQRNPISLIQNNQTKPPADRPPVAEQSKMAGETRRRGQPSMLCR